MKIRIAHALVATALLTACSKAVTSRGFIPSGVKMKEQGDMVHEWRATGLDAKQFGKVVILPTQMPAGDSYGDLEPSKLEEVRGIFDAALKAEFGSSLGSGPKTLVIHAAVTEIKPNKPLLNVAPQTQILRRGYGYGACEIFATDGEGGPVVAAFMQTSDTERLGAEKLSPTGTVEKACGTWSKSFHELLTR